MDFHNSTYMIPDPGDSDTRSAISNVPTMPLQFGSAQAKMKQVKLSEIPLSVLVLENPEVKKLWADYHDALAQVVTSSKEILESTRCIQSVFMSWRETQSQASAQGSNAK